MCGACCYNVAEHGLEEKEDGSCINLQDDLSCGIYEDRPDVCRTPEGTPHDLLIKACKYLEKEMIKNRK